MTEALFIRDKILTDPPARRVVYQGVIFIVFLNKNRGSITLEFAICGLLFIGFILGMVVISLWMYNVSQVKQAARIAAYNVAMTGNQTEAGIQAFEYLNRSLVACPVKGAQAYSSDGSGYGVAMAEMEPLFPGFQRIIDPKGASTINGRIQIRKEAVTVRAHRLRSENRDQYN